MTAERDNALEILSCDIELRPVGAPGAPQLAASLRRVERPDGGTLVVAFDAAAASDVEAFVAAERHCCADLGWHVETLDAETRLRITATPRQIDIFQQIFTPPS